MLPGLGGMNPRQMQRLMEQMGIKSTTIEAAEVIVKKKDGTELVVSSPQVTMMDVQGQKTLQIAGTISEREAGPSEDDIKLVSEQVGCTTEEAVAALKDAKGEIAAAIMKLQEKRGHG